MEQARGGAKTSVMQMAAAAAHRIGDILKRAKFFFFFFLNFSLQKT